GAARRRWPGAPAAPAARCGSSPRRRRPAPRSVPGLWPRPRTVAPSGHDLADEVDGGPALLVEGEDLQLGGGADLAEADPGRHLEVGRGEVQDRGDTGRDQPVADLLGGGRRGGDD